MIIFSAANNYKKPKDTKHIFEGDIVSYIRQNTDRTRDQIYLKAVKCNRQTCKQCWLYDRETLNNKKDICQMCFNTMNDFGLNIMFEFDSVKQQ